MKRQRNNNNDGDYRCVEAMYRRGCTVDDIVNSTGISKMDVLDIGYCAEDIRVRHEKESSKLGLFVFFFLSREKQLIL